MHVSFHSHPIFSSPIVIASFFVCSKADTSSHRNYNTEVWWMENNTIQKLIQYRKTQCINWCSHNLDNAQYVQIIEWRFKDCFQILMIFMPDEQMLIVELFIVANIVKTEFKESRIYTHTARTHIVHIFEYNK